MIQLAAGSRRKAGRNFWLHSLPASTTGLAVGVAAAAGLALILDQPIYESQTGTLFSDQLLRRTGLTTAVPFAAALLGIVGLAVGLAQWLGLGSSRDRFGWWIPASILGWALIGAGIGSFSRPPGAIVLIVLLLLTWVSSWILLRVQGR